MAGGGVLRRILENAICKQKRDTASVGRSTVCTVSVVFPHLADGFPHLADRIPCLLFGIGVRVLGTLGHARSAFRVWGLGTLGHARSAFSDAMV